MMVFDVVQIILDICIIVLLSRIIRERNQEE